MSTAWVNQAVKLYDLGYFMDEHKLEVVEWKVKRGPHRRDHWTLVCKERDSEEQEDLGDTDGS